MNDREKIWVFGDSYGDLKSIVNPNSFSWAQSLSKKYKVENFCERGSGVSYSLNLLNKKVSYHKNLELKNTNLIFIIPEVSRINFKFFNNPHDQVYTTDIIRFIKPKYDDRSNKNLNYYREKYSEFVKNFFKFYIWADPDYYQNTLLKTAGNIFLYKTMFKSILCFTVNTSISFLDKNNLNDDNFYFFNYPLFEISKSEECGNITQIGSEIRNHHLNESNNRVLYEQVCDWIDNRFPIDLNKFDRSLFSDKLKNFFKNSF